MSIHSDVNRTHSDIHRAYIEAMVAVGFNRSQPKWYVASTRRDCEQSAREALDANGFESFLPVKERWRNGPDMNMRYLFKEPIFPGYVFVHHCMDRWSYLGICRSRGVTDLLGPSWDSLSVVPDHEVAAIHGLQRSRLPHCLYPYPCEGQSVRVVEGPLAGVEGNLVQVDRQHTVLVISIDIIRQSVAVEVKRSQTVPLRNPSLYLAAGT
jgi:transcription antitermination factor NusG